MDVWLIWLITAAMLAVAEIFTLTAALGMLAAAALVTAGFAAVGLPLPLQFLVFTIVATVSVLFVRPLVLGDRPACSSDVASNGACARRAG